MTLVVVPAAVVAYPEGAPWGAADPDADENCATCHFDHDAKLDSAAISIDGLPAKATAGEKYELVICFDDAGAVLAGFQLLARATHGGAGSFHSADAATETGDSGIRSTNPSINDNGVEWHVAWTAPDVPGATVRFFLAVTGSNNDGSPFGDQLHFRAFSARL